MNRLRWLWLALGCLVLPVTARADGIDLPILIGFGVGVVLPLLLFNATVEAPIMGRILGVRFSELWVPWLKANIWSLLAGFPALVLNEALTEGLLPAELSKRFRVYPFFLVLCIFVFFSATCLVEFLYARRIVRNHGVQVGPVEMAKAVLLANLVSYAVLGPLYFLIERPRTDVHEFSSDTRWSKQPALPVVAVGPTGLLETANAGGGNRRVVVPYEVRDYVVSADLAQVLYRGAADRFYFWHHGTNQPIPDPGFWCRAPEMDFSPSGSYAAFYNSGAHQIRVFDNKAAQFKNVPAFGSGTFDSLVWSTKEDTLYLKSREQCWEISLEPAVAYRKLVNPPEDFADHFGRVGNSWSRDGVSYGSAERAGLRLFVLHGWGSRLSISRDRERLMQVKDPAGGLAVHQAAFLNDNEIFVELGDYLYIVDVAMKRIGPVMQGAKSIALTAAFAKGVVF